MGAIGRAVIGVALVGVAVGVRLLAREGERARTEGMIDWAVAEASAIGIARRAPGALAPAEVAASGAAWEETLARVIPVLERRLSAPLPGVVERHAVVDRAGWVHANLGTFRRLAERLEPLLSPVDGIGPAGSVARGANRVASTRQVGFLLGWLASRVLGQYDIALLSAEESPGRLLLVEENIRHLSRELDLPLDELRTWIALHEATHAWEMEANPWVRPWLRERLDRQIDRFVAETREMARRGVPGLLARGRDVGRHGLTLGLLGPEAREGFREIQRMMSLLEGFGDWVMDAAGEELLPDVARLRDRFEARRGAPRRGLDRLVARLAGLDLKLEQYHRGERFIAAIVRDGGDPAIRRLWAGPEALPTEEEMDEPALWLRRTAEGAPA